ncbi:MAG: glycosyltransferase, partial [Rikenellaceae bacterium]
DVKFLTDDWGVTMIKKLQEKDCGCVGFAGSILKMAYPSGWFVNGHNTRHHYRQLYTNRRKNASDKTRNPDNCDYSEVVTLDGMALFVSKYAWNKCKFDQESLKGFHCYDIDFTINLANSSFKNYVTNLLFIEHFSEGAFSEHWRDETIANFDKWKHVLPLYASNISKKCRSKHYPKAYYNTIKTILKHDLYTGVPKREISDHIKKHPMELSSWKLLRLYTKYKSRYEPN